MRQKIMFGVLIAVITVAVLYHGGVLAAGQ